MLPSRLVLNPQTTPLGLFLSTPVSISPSAGRGTSSSPTSQEQEKYQGMYFGEYSRVFQRQYLSGVLLGLCEGIRTHSPPGSMTGSCSPVVDILTLLLLGVSNDGLGSHPHHSHQPVSWQVGRSCSMAGPEDARAP